jgi:hypothetical protein
MFESASTEPYLHSRVGSTVEFRGHCDDLSRLPASSYIASRSYADIPQKAQATRHPPKMLIDLLSAY